MYRLRSGLSISRNSRSPTLLHGGSEGVALRAQKATGNAPITVLADRGYFNGEEVLACESSGVLPYVAKPLTSGNAKRGLFTGQDFIYDAEKIITPVRPVSTRNRLSVSTTRGPFFRSSNSEGAYNC